MKVPYGNRIINHQIAPWGTTFLRIQLAMAWTRYTYFEIKQNSNYKSLPFGQQQEILMLQNQVIWLKLQNCLKVLMELHCTKKSYLLCFDSKSFARYEHLLHKGFLCWIRTIAEKLYKAKVVIYL